MYAQPLNPRPDRGYIILKHCLMDDFLVCKPVRYVSLRAELHARTEGGSFHPRHGMTMESRRSSAAAPIPAP